MINDDGIGNYFFLVYIISENFVVSFEMYC